eukprot:1030079-Amphidinium_carterae.1
MPISNGLQPCNKSRVITPHRLFTLLVASDPQQLPKRPVARNCALKYRTIGFVKLGRLSSEPFARP